MTLQLLSAKLTGDPVGKRWSQVYETNPQDSEGSQERGHLFCIISSDYDSHDPQTFHLLEKVYYQENQKSSFEALTESVNTLKAADTNDIIAVSIIGNTVYAVLKGSVCLFILRQGNLLPLSVTSPGDQTSLSGYLQEQDSLLLATHDFIHGIPIEKVQEILSQAANAVEAVEYFAPLVRGSLKDSSAMAAIVVTYSNTYKSPASIRTSREKLLAFIDKILAKLPQQKLTVALGESDHKSRNRRVVVLIGIILMIILGVSIVFGVKKKEQDVKRNDYESRLSVARKDLEDARGLKDVSGEKARALLLDAKKIVDELQSNPVKTADLALVAGAINDSLGTIAGLYRVTPELYLDLDLVSSNFSVDDIAYSEGHLGILDKNAKKLVEIDVPTKKTQVVAGPDQVEGALDIAQYEDRAFVLKNDGVYEVKASSKLVISKDWQGDALIFTFAGNLYVLDKQASQIYRFPGTVNGFGSKTNWLSTDITAHFADVRLWAIDGSIWTLSDGDISRYSLGRKDIFSMPNEVAEVTSFYTDENSDGVYILDSGQSKLILTDKKGQYKAEYEDALIHDASRIVVDTTSKKIFLFVGSKIYSIELKHL